MKKIFISHSNRNKKFIKNLKSLLPDKKYLVWVSFDDIKPGKDTSEKIKKNLEECDVIIFILTDQALQSAYVNQEIGYAVARGKEILPVIDYKKKALPGFLHGKDAIKLFPQSSEKTFYEISPYLDDKDLYRKPLKETSKEKTLALTKTGYDVWFNILDNMKKDAAPISSFVGTYSSYSKKEKSGKKKIDKRIEAFKNFFVTTKLVESVNLEDMKDRIYNYEDLKNWQNHLNMSVLYKLSNRGREWLEKLELGDTWEIIVEKYNELSIACDPSSGGTGTTVTITISVDGNTSPVSSAFGLSLHYDTSIFQYLNTSKGTLTSSWAAVDGGATSGTITVGGFRGSGSVISTGSQGSIAVVRLQVIAGSGQTTQITMNNLIDDIVGMIINPSSVTFTRN